MIACDPPPSRGEIHDSMHGQFILAISSTTAVFDFRCLPRCAKMKWLSWIRNLLHCVRKFCDSIRTAFTSTITLLVLGYWSVLLAFAWRILLPPLAFRSFSCSQAFHSFCTSPLLICICCGLLEVFSSWIDTQVLALGWFSPSWSYITW